MTREELNSFFDSLIFCDIFILDLVLYRARLCKRLKSPVTASLCSLSGRYVIKSCRTGPPGWKSIPGLFKQIYKYGLCIYFSETAVRVTMNKWHRKLMMRPGYRWSEVTRNEGWEGGRKNLKHSARKAAEKDFNSASLPALHLISRIYMS